MNSEPSNTEPINKDKTLDINNSHHAFLSKLGKLSPSDLPTVSEAEKARLRMDFALSLPNNVQGQGYVGALDLDEDILPDRPSEVQTPDKIPLHEPIDDVDPNGDDDFYKEMNALDYPVSLESSIVTRNRFETKAINGKEFVASYSKQDQIYTQLTTAKTQLINGKNSYISFSIKNNQGFGDLTLDECSIANIFKKITCTLPDGQIVDVLDKCNIYNDIIDNVVKGPDYIVGGVSELKGYGVVVVPFKRTFIIMLSDLIPLFNIESLLPSSITNLMKIVIDLEEPIVAFSDVGIVVPDEVTYTVSDFKYVLDSYYIDYDFMKKINKLPLTIEYKSYQTVSVPTTINFNRIELDVTKSRMINVIVRVEQANYNENQILSSNMIKSTSFFNNANSSVQWTVGDVVYPELPILDKKESYINTMKTFRNLNSYINTIPFTKYELDDYCDVLDLNRSLFGVEGTPIDNTNSIVYRYKLADNNTPYIVHFFCVHLKRLNIYPFSKNHNMNYDSVKFEISD